jgi:hypothetical protein
MSTAEKQHPAAAATTISLWGATQVGKTTTLAAYVGKYRPQWIDRSHGDTQSSLFELLETWNALLRNRLAPATAEGCNLTLRHRDHRTLGFRDMVGGHTDSPKGNVVDAKALMDAPAAMFFLEWPGQQTVQAVTALGNALQLLPRNGIAALVITKCESHLSAADFAAFAEEPLVFARDHKPLQSLVEPMSSFTDHFPGGQIFPLTVYGWNGDRPAHFYDEFGRLVPWNIQPALVDRPFNFILHRLGLGKEAR